MSEKRYIAAGWDLSDVCKNTLENMGCGIFLMRPFPCLDAPTASHPDMLFSIVGRDFITSRSYYEQESETMDAIAVAGMYKLTISDTMQHSPYPHDIAFNALVINGCLIGNLTNISSEIIESADAQELKKINVRQGYAACSTAKVSRNAIITADAGIAEASREMGCDALLIKSGHIELCGYDYGFIGGASGLIGGKLCFCGDVTAHPNYNEMKRFCDSYDTEIVSLSNEKLRDCGGIIEII